MSTSIYDPPEWSSGATFAKWDIAWRTSAGVRYYWYSTVDSNTNNQPSETSIQWDGNVTFLGKIRPEFIWVPNYGPVVAGQPRINRVSFGDGYEQRVATEIHTDLLQFELTFEKRQIAEATSLLHFLHQRGGKEAFAWTPPQPYGKAKLFVTDNWNMTQPFYNNHSVQVRMREVPA